MGKIARNAPLIDYAINLAHNVLKLGMGVRELPITPMRSIMYVSQERQLTIASMIGKKLAIRLLSIIRLIAPDSIMIHIIILKPAA